MEKEKLHTTREQIENLISETPNEDETLAILERAMEYYCGTWDKCEGYKHALLETLADQYDNHPEDQEADDLDKLADILNGAI